MAADFFLHIPGGAVSFMGIVIVFFLFVGTFMDAIPAMILFVPIILPGSHSCRGGSGALGVGGSDDSGSGAGNATVRPVSTHCRGNIQSLD